VGRWRYNRRTDRCRGSLENRARFYIEIMAALKRAVGDRLAVTTRFETDTINGGDPPLPFIREPQVWGQATYPKLGDPRPKIEVS
jgi:2,4-dienoyl-CoA reductase-like NADH-dependent reductase (Old Yellow Enzyme family)